MYICFINGLLREILEKGLGAEVLNISAGDIGYADDTHSSNLVITIAHASLC